MSKKRKPQRRYSEELKHKACKAVLYEGLSIKETREKYDIRAVGAISSWMYQLGYKGEGNFSRKGIRRTYSETFKRQVSYQIHSGSLTKTEAARKYGIPSLTAITEWVKQYPYSLEVVNEADVSIVRTDIFKHISDISMPQKQNQKALQSEINLLKKQLEEALLEAEVNSKVVEIASKELGIDIRKKFNTKQSKK